MAHGVIVGFDESDQARDALALGEELSDWLGARLLVASALPFAPLADYPRSYFEAAGGYFDHVEGLARSAGSREFEWRAIQDTAVHGLRALARAEAADVLVLGSTHRGRLGRVFPGSVAEALLRHSSCAIAVAPKGHAAETRPRLRRIGVAFDGSTEGWDALGFAVVLARRENAQLTLLTGIGGRDEQERRVQDDEAEQRLLDLALSYTEGLVVEARALPGEAGGELPELSAELSLLCIGARGHGALGRALAHDAASRLARSASCPVALLPGAGEGMRRWRDEVPVATESSS